MSLLFPFRRKKQEKIADNEIVGSIHDSHPKNSVRAQIKGISTFIIEIAELKTKRDDLFKEGQFSVFDVLVGLA